MNTFSHRLILWATFAICLLFGLWVRANYDPEWYRADNQGHFRPWAVEADCYSRLNRVQHILNGGDLIQSFHKFENWPYGMIPSTTAPLDYCILALYFPLKLITIYPLDWAGAVVSPLCWVALLIFWAFVPLRNFQLRSRLALLIGSATFFGFFWATAFGRPDHQSLILLLFGLVLTAEYERWNEPNVATQRWHIFTGLAWGLVLWTSLFEPVIIFVLLILFNLIARRKENPTMLISCGSVLLIAFILEGVHVFVPTSKEAIALENWGQMIGELKGMTLVSVIVDFTFILFVLPFIALRVLVSEKSTRTDLFLVLLTTALVIATLFQVRWIYYSSLGEVLILARYFQVSQSFWRQGSVALFCLLALTYSIAATFELPRSRILHQASPDLKELAGCMDQPGGIMAPWWVSSGLGYFSGQPVVACSSHCSVAGLIDSAAFYASTSWLQANLILQQRKVRWVVVYDDPHYDYPLLNGTGRVLGRPPFSHSTNDDPDPKAELTVAQKLIKGELVPPRYHLRCLVNGYKLYEFK